jgi:hypothetical protein
MRIVSYRVVEIRCGVGLSVAVVWCEGGIASGTCTSHSPNGRVEKVAGGGIEFVLLASFDAQRR